MYVWSFVMGVSGWYSKFKVVPVWKASSHFTTSDNPVASSLQGINLSVITTAFHAVS